MQLSKQARPILLVALLALTACQGEGGDQANDRDVREFYTDVQTASIQASVQADFGDRVSNFTLRYNYDAAGAQQVTVLAPQEIAGVSVSIEEDGSRLTFDGLILETGVLPGTGLSPLEALPCLWKSLRDGYVKSRGHDTVEGVDCLRLVYAITYGENELEQQLWLAKDTLHLIKAEIYADGSRVIACTIEQLAL